MKKFFICCFVFLFLFITNICEAKVKITPLKDSDVFPLLKEYEIYNDVCSVYLDRYSVIEGIEYYDFDNNLKNDGVIVVLDAVADSVVKIFEDLKKIHFNIYNIHPTALYKKNWYGAIVMPDDFNGTESFVCRKVEHTDRLSLHSYGVALDVNFLQNPCIFIDEKTYEIQNVVPKNGAKYFNRCLKRKNKEDQDIGKVDSNVIRIFKKHGYDVWGGNWDFPVDYQHFQASTRTFADLLMVATKEDAKSIFNTHVKCLRKTNNSLVELADEKNVALIDMYKNNNGKFFKEIQSWC